jgi:hypothetical protein
MLASVLMTERMRFMNDALSTIRTLTLIGGGIVIVLAIVLALLSQQLGAGVFIAVLCAFLVAGMSFARIPYLLSRQRYRDARASTLRTALLATFFCGVLPSIFFWIAFAKYKDLINMPMMAAAPRPMAPPFPAASPMLAGSPPAGVAPTVRGISATRMAPDVILQQQSEGYADGFAAASLPYALTPLPPNCLPRLQDMPEPDCMPAFDAYQQHRASTIGKAEERGRFWYARVEKGDFTAGARAFFEGMAGSISDQVIGSTYSPTSARYFAQWSRWSNMLPQPLLCYQFTYLRAIVDPGRPTVIQRQYRTVTTYPPSPVLNLVGVALPGRCAGEFVCTKATLQKRGGFIPSPSRSYHPALLDALNRELAQPLRWLFDRDQDVLSGNLTRRDQSRLTETSFWPTLFETSLWNVETWPQYPRIGQSIFVNQTRATYRDYTGKYFALIVSPYRDKTIFLLSYPASSQFGYQGELLSTDLALPVVRDLIHSIAMLLHIPGNAVPVEEYANEKHLYWSLVGQSRQTTINVPPPWGWFWHPTRPDLNLCVPPLQWILEEIERGGR